MRILYKFPSRGRPAKFFAHLDNIIEMSEHDDYLIQPTIDNNDYSWTVESKIKLQQNKYVSKIIYGVDIDGQMGRSTSKIHACNRDLYTGDWDIVICTSDDMVITETGFDLKIIKHMQETFPDTDGVLHYSDGFNHDPIVSWPVIGKKYYERYGYIYFPGYQSLYCDEELYIVAQQTGKLKSFPEETFLRHDHPMNTGNLQTYDSVYKQNDKFYQVDKALFERRKKRNFFIQ